MVKASQLELLSGDQSLAVPLQPSLCAFKMLQHSVRRRFLLDPTDLVCELQLLVLDPLLTHAMDLRIDMFRRGLSLAPSSTFTLFMLLIRLRSQRTGELVVGLFSCDQSKPMITAARGGS